MALLPPGCAVNYASKVEAVVMIEPKGKGRPRAVVRKTKDGGARGGVATDKKDVDWKKRFNHALVFAKMKMLDKIRHLRGKPLRFELELYFQKSKSNKSWWCNAKVDNDNSEKSVWDAMNDEKAWTIVGNKKIQDVIEGFIQDDHHIVSNETVKCWAADRPYIVFRIYEITQGRA